MIYILFVMQFLIYIIVSFILVNKMLCLLILFICFVFFFQLQKNEENSEKISSVVVCFIIEVVIDRKEEIVEKIDFKFVEIKFKLELGKYGK